jgi:hypothetical protein
VVGGRGVIRGGAALGQLIPPGTRDGAPLL